MRAASPPRQMERENEMIVISQLLFSYHQILSPQNAGGILFQDAFVLQVGENYIDTLE